MLMPRVSQDNKAYTLSLVKDYILITGSDPDKYPSYFHVSKVLYIMHTMTETNSVTRKY